MIGRFERIMLNMFNALLLPIKAIRAGALLSIKMSYRPSVRKCIIIGNGPSLNDSLSGEDPWYLDGVTVCMGEFARTDFYKKVKPRIYYLVDPQYYMADIPEAGKRERDALFAKLAEDTDWPLLVVAPIRAKKENVLPSLAERNKNISFWYYKNIVYDGPPLVMNYLFKKNIAMPRPQNTLIAAIYFSLNMGFNRIMLVGADHSWTENIEMDEKNTLKIRNNYHYYDADGKGSVPFIKDTSGNVFKMHELMEAMYHTFRGYFVLQAYAVYLGAKISNASGKSFIDAFERISPSGRAK